MAPEPPWVLSPGAHLSLDPGLTGEAVPAWGNIACRICVSAAFLGEVSYAFTEFKEEEGKQEERTIVFAG